MDTAVSDKNETGAVRKAVLIWHRRDLRLRDNALYEGLYVEGTTQVAEDTSLVCLYVFDDAHYVRRRSIVSREWDALRTGPHACNFTLEAVADLRASLRAMDQELLVRRGDSAAVVSALVVDLLDNLGPSGDVEVRFAALMGTEEGEEEEAVRVAIGAIGGHRVRLCEVPGVQTLWHPHNLPSSPEDWQTHANPTPMTTAGRHKFKQPEQTQKREARRHATTGAPIIMSEWRRAVLTSITNNFS
jgi:deoxyribodipyrimidine photolyase